GYRRNREVVCSLDFFDDPSSAPARPALDALAFLEALAPWVRATPGATERLAARLGQVRALLARWRQMPPDFRDDELPRVSFVACLPAWEGRPLRSPMDQVLGTWGGRRASEVVVMTPFVGDGEGGRDRVIDRLMQARSRDAVGRLVVPGRPAGTEG